MKLYRISQNIEYLEKIGVPEVDRAEILDFLLALDKNSRKIILRKIGKNPLMSLNEIKKIGTDTKKQYLKSLGYEDSIVAAAMALSPKYSVWIAREIKNHREIPKSYESQVTYDYPWTAPLSTWESSPREIIDYIEQNNPDLMSMSYKEVAEESDKWHEELARKAEEEASQYKTHEVVYTLNNGWEIVKLGPGDCEPEGNNMGHCVGGYSQDIAEGKVSIFLARSKE